MARNLLHAFRPASWRGVPFSVMVDDFSGGRRLAVHDIAYGETPFVEDMGKAAHRYSVTAYVSGETFDARAQALVAALVVKGAGTLVLPLDGALRARVESWARSREKDTAGYIAFDIQFVEAGVGTAPFSAIAGIGAIGAILSAGAAILATALSGAYRGQLDGRSTLDTDKAAGAGSAARALASITLAATSLPADAESALTGLETAGLAAIADPGAFSASLVEAWRLVAVNCDPESLADEIALSLSTAADSATAAAVNGAMIGAYAMAVVGREYKAQADAAAERAALASVAAQVIDDAAVWLGDEASAWVAQLTGEAALSLSSGAAWRAPLVAVETAAPISAIAAAYALYGDAGRDVEIVNRNRLGDPVNLPLRFEAVAPDD